MRSPSSSSPAPTCLPPIPSVSATPKLPAEDEPGSSGDGAYPPALRLKPEPCLPTLDFGDEGDSDWDM